MTGQQQQASRPMGERCAEAVRHHRAGRYLQAERLYREILDVDPTHVDSLHLLGVLVSDSGRPDEAVELIGRALEKAPDYAAAYQNLANALLLTGRADEAVAASRRALELRPEHAGAHYTLGNAYLNSGKPAEAVRAYQRAVELKPEYARAWNNMGNALQRLGCLTEAEAAYRAALALMPEDGDFSNNLANVLKDSGRPEEALTLYDRAASLRQPGFERFLANKALLLMEMGDGAAALQATQEALLANPRCVAAWHIRSALKKFTAEDVEQDLRTMEALLVGPETRRQGDLGLSDRIRLQFSVGKAWLDVDDPVRGFAHLHAANRLKRSTFDYDGALVERRIEDIVASFTPDLLRELSGAGHRSQVPVFVVGMPRSGTTLVEQILASHPEVHGAGELRTLSQLVPGRSQSEPEPCPPPYPPLLAQLSHTELARLGAEYEARACSTNPDKQRVIDKMPANFLYAGLIHVILPNARIIHCRRDAMDTCLSCYVHPFCGDVAFAYELGELGRYYRQYERLMDHWRSLLPTERFLEVHYEDLVAHLEREARRLVDFCGLRWHECCLAFHQTRRQVQTASATQVRRPIYSSSIGRWKRYADHLGPLLAALRE